MKKRHILATTGLIYANGSIHLGHMLEMIQADIWVRFQRLQGHICFFISGDDAHGTPVMISAQQKNMKPEQLIDAIYQEHQSDLAAFSISFDHFYTTHSKENKDFVERIYQKLQQNGDIAIRSISQAFDAKKNMFLPDRFIKGQCPRCHSDEQYGDHCEVCGATYSPVELIHPRSVISGTLPILKTSEHYFFKLDRYTNSLKQWLNTHPVQQSMTNKLQEWFSEGLKPWDISRDQPYFGFKIPNTQDKYFYVWLDAPVGYMASFQHFLKERDDICFNDYWKNSKKTELVHFVGKDIVYFHALFWPAILQSGGFRLPNKILTHGFLTINGQKMSKSRCTFITAKAYLNQLNPEYLRYYYAAKLTAQVEDIDLNFDDFEQRVNADIVGKVVNIASRCAKLLDKHCSRTLAHCHHNEMLYRTLCQAGEEIAHFYDHLELSKAVRCIMSLADQLNQYIDQQKPWVLAQHVNQLEQMQSICTQGINGFRLLMIYLKPILPKMAEQAESFLNITPLDWCDRHQPLFHHKLNVFKPLMQRVDKNKIKQLIQGL